MSTTSSTDSKCCKVCGETKDDTKFKINGKKKDGSDYRSATCRDCLDLRALEKKLGGGEEGSAKIDPKMRILLDTAAGLKNNAKGLKCMAKIVREL